MRIRVGAVANRGGARKGSVGSEVRNRDSSSYYGCVILFVGGPISQANGWVAQLAEQRTENPRVGGSIPPPATSLATQIRFFYSVRRAVIGFTWVARRAGRKQARSAAMVSITLEVIRANGSLGLT